MDEELLSLLRLRDDVARAIAVAQAENDRCDDMYHRYDELSAQIDALWASRAHARTKDDDAATPR